MDNFDKYTYARTLRFFEAYYPYDNEDIHYADVMLSMNQCKSIDELIKVREHLRSKIKKMDSTPMFYKLQGEFIEELSKDKSVNLPWNFKEILSEDTNSCYDENVFRLFKDSKIITENICGEFFINLSNCNKKSPYIELIASEAKERSNIEVTELLFTIAKRYKVFGKHWEKYKEFEKGMNGYNFAKEVVEDDFEYLRQFNWRLLPEQISLYGEIDREAQKRKKVHAKFLKEQKEERERQEKLEEEKKRKREKTNETIWAVIGSIVVLGIIIAIFSGGGENYLFAIVIILALMKAGIMK